MGWQGKRNKRGLSRACRLVESEQIKAMGDSKFMLWSETWETKRSLLSLIKKKKNREESPNWTGQKNVELLQNRICPPQDRVHSDIKEKKRMNNGYWI